MQFEGWLHERDEVSDFGEAETIELGCCHRDRKIRQVHGHDVDGMRHVGGCNGTQVVTFEVDDSRVEAESADELADSSIDGVDPAGTSREQGRREPSS